MNKVFSDPTGQVSAKVIAHSKSSVTGKEMVTFEWEFPRLILAEVNTHKMLNKNTSSSRAIPVNTINNNIMQSPSMPVRFGAKNKGMQDNGKHSAKVNIRMSNGEYVEVSPETAWSIAAKKAIEDSEAFNNADYAKQICNRLTEPFQRVKMVISGTEWNNFFWLRHHHMADPTMEALAKCAKQALEASTPTILQPGEWHVPYYNDGVWKHCTKPLKRYAPMLVEGGFIEVEVDSFGHSLQQALDISASCCAQASYRKLEDTLEKAAKVVANLNLHGEQPDDPVHASPLEHQASPIEPCSGPVKGEGDSIRPCAEVNSPFNSDTWQDGITHMDRDGMLCSGNLKGFIQHRQLVPNHVKKG